MLSGRRRPYLHKAKIQDWDLCDTAEEESCRFIIDSVDDVWIAELEKKTTKYAEVKAIDMIRHLRKTALATHKVDILELQDQMRELHLKVDSIPEHVEAMEKAQEPSECAGDKISDAMMVNIAQR